MNLHNICMYVNNNKLFINIHFVFFLKKIVFHALIKKKLKSHTCTLSVKYQI